MSYNYKYFFGSIFLIKNFLLFIFLLENRFIVNSFIFSIFLKYINVEMNKWNDIDLNN